MNKDLQVGFKEVSYSVVEGEALDHITFEVEVKNSRLFVVPIELSVTDTEIEARSKFNSFLVLLYTI